MSATMTNGTATANNTWQMRVEYDFDCNWVRVTSTPTGKKTLLVDTEGLDRESIFSPLELALYEALCNGVNNRHETFTQAQLAQLVTMRDKCNALRTIGKPIEVVEVKEVTQPVPSPQNDLARHEERRQASEVVRDTERRTGSNAIDYAEQRVDRLKNVIDKVSTRDYCTLYYDIPQHLNSKCPNPSKILWRHGFRSSCNKSVWTIDRSHMTHRDMVRLIATWKEYGIRYGTRRFHPDEIQDIRREAQEELDREIRRLHTSLIQRIDNADKALKEALDVGPMTPNEIKEADDYRNGQVRTMIKDAVEAYKGVLECAELFDNTMELAPLLQGLRDAIRAQATAFNVIAHQKRIKAAPTV